MLLETKNSQTRKNGKGKCGGIIHKRNQNVDGNGPKRGVNVQITQKGRGEQKQKEVPSFAGDRTAVSYGKGGKRGGQ